MLAVAAATAAAGMTVVALEETVIDLVRSNNALLIDASTSALRAQRGARGKTRTLRPAPASRKLCLYRLGELCRKHRSSRGQLAIRCVNLQQGLPAIVIADLSATDPGVTIPACADNRGRLSGSGASSSPYLARQPSGRLSRARNNPQRR